MYIRHIKIYTYVQFCNVSAEWAAKKEQPKEMQSKKQIIWETSEDKRRHELGLEARLDLKWIERQRKKIPITETVGEKRMKTGIHGTRLRPPRRRGGLTHRGLQEGGEAEAGAGDQVTEDDNYQRYLQFTLQLKFLSYVASDRSSCFENAVPGPLGQTGRMEAERQLIWQPILADISANKIF